MSAGSTQQRERPRSEALRRSALEAGVMFAVLYAAHAVAVGGRPVSIAG